MPLSYEAAEETVRQLAAAHVPLLAGTDAPNPGTAPGVTIPSVALVVEGDHRRMLRDRPLPVIARVADGSTWCDLRAVGPGHDEELADALRSVVA